MKFKIRVTPPVGPYKGLEFYKTSIRFFCGFWPALSVLLKSYKVSELKPELNIAFKQKHLVSTSF